MTNIKPALVFGVLLFIEVTKGQIYLRADGSSDTYGLINRVLGGTAVEVPDCNHGTFGPHITQTQDSTLNRQVFVFHAHVTPDNDRCQTFDRQRTEIKTYGPSPSYLKGFLGDTVSLSWNFKLDAGFRPSPSFTHIHQIKPVDGNDAMPIITLTPRKASPNNTMQLIHVGDDGKTTYLAQVQLTPFLGEWVHVTSTVNYNTAGRYEMTVTRMRDNTQLMYFSSNNIEMWRTGSTFGRPKWGIYRSLNNAEDLRDEQVRFDNFCLAKDGHRCT